MISLLTMLAIAQIEPPKPFPDVTFQNMKGEAVSIQQFSGKKVVLFNWASW